VRGGHRRERGQWAESPRGRRRAGRAGRLLRLVLRKHRRGKHKHWRAHLRPPCVTGVLLVTGFVTGIRSQAPFQASSQVLPEAPSQAPSQAPRHRLRHRLRHRPVPGSVTGFVTGASHRLRQRPDASDAVQPWSCRSSWRGQQVPPASPPRCAPIQYDPFRCGAMLYSRRLLSSPSAAAATGWTQAGHRLITGWSQASSQAGHKFRHRLITGFVTGWSQASSQAGYRLVAGWLQASLQAGHRLRHRLGHRLRHRLGPRVLATGSSQVASQAPGHSVLIALWHACDWVQQPSAILEITFCSCF